MHEQIVENPCRCCDDGCFRMYDLRVWDWYPGGSPDYPGGRTTAAPVQDGHSITGPGWYRCTIERPGTVGTGYARHW